MAHNINFNQEKQTHSFVSARLPAWHNLGTILPDKFTSEEALQYANLDFKVDMAPVFAKFTSDPNVENAIANLENYSCTFRTDNRKPFGIVGSKYKVVQNKDAFKFFDTIVGEGKAVYETAGALGNGEVIFISAKLPDYIVLPGDDITEKYLLLSMSHDGTRPITCMFTPTRVVCANTLAIAFGNGSNRIVIRHTASAHDRLKEAAKVMGITNKISIEMTELLTKLSKIKVTDTQVEDYIEMVFLTPEERKQLAVVGYQEGAHREVGISTQKIRTMEYINDFYHTGIGQNTLSTEGTLFGAYSAVTGYMFNVKEYKNTESKVKSLVMEGEDYKINAHALNVAKQLIPSLC